MKWFLMIFLINTAQAKELYVLPQDIIEARDRVIASKRKLDDNINKRYRELCLQKELNQAQYMEMLAYKEITGFSCFDFITIPVH